jgi:hypothetical protein
VKVLVAEIDVDVDVNVTTCVVEVEADVVMGVEDVGVDAVDEYNWILPGPPQL